MTDRIILHGMSSPNVVKVALMLEECSLDYETRHVAVFRQGQFTPEFLAMNPMSKVPVLEDSRLARGGRTMALAESGAILMWLAEREGRFLPSPADPVARAETIQWVMYQMANYGPVLGQLNHFAGVLKPGTEPYAEGRYRGIAARLYRMLDDRLHDNEWLAGGAYSIADMAMHSWSYYVERHGFDGADYPALVAWRSRIAERPAAIAAQARVAQDFSELVAKSRDEATEEDLDRFFSRGPEVPKADFMWSRR